MEIMFQINSIKDLQTISCMNVRWLDIYDDFILFREHLAIQGHYLKKEDLQNRQFEGINYCGLFKNGKIVARAAVERYSENKWETADVRVIPQERGKGYGKQVVYFVTKYILDNKRIATCRTKIDNIAMQNIALSVGFKKET